MSIEHISGVKFITPDHRCYESVLDFVLATASLGSYFKVYHGYSVTTFAPNDKNEYPSLLFAGLSSGRHLSFIPHELFNDVILKNTRVSRIPYTEQSDYTDADGVQLDASSIFDGFTIAMFIRYYENYLDTWEQKYGRAQDGWPEVLRFARVVRNSMGHGGAIDIRNASERPVKHFGLTYSHSNNGRLIRSDLSSADIFFLMIDMDLEF